MTGREKRLVIGHLGRYSWVSQALLHFKLEWAVPHAEGAFVHHQGQPATAKEPGMEDRKIIIGQGGQKGFDKLRKIEWHRSNEKEMIYSPKFTRLRAVFVGSIPDIQHFWFQTIENSSRKKRYCTLR
jgi:hypothetical protein